jgi:hypothetical protein
MSDTPKKSLVMIRELTCPVSGDAHSAPMVIGNEPSFEGISPCTAIGLVRLYARPELEWTKVTTISGPGGQDVTFIVDSDMTDRIAQLKAGGFHVRHGDVYETDELMQARNEETQDQATFSGTVDRKVYTGKTEKLTREHLSSPEGQAYIEHMKPYLDRALSTTPTTSTDDGSESNGAREADPAQQEGPGPDADRRGQDGPGLPDGE